MRAQDWALLRRRDLLTEKFIKDLHRLMADLLIMRLGADRFTWRSDSLQRAANLQQANDVRRSYITALKAADAHEYALLLTFARS